MARAQLFGRDDQVQIKNPTNKDFIFAWDGKRYKVGAGKETICAGYMAEQYVHKIVDLMMQMEEKGDQIMVEPNRLPYYKRVIMKVHKMQSLDDSGAADGDIVDLGASTMPSSNPVVKQVVGDAKPDKAKKKLKELPDPAIDEELNLDDLPDDKDLFPEPEKDENGNYISDEEAAKRKSKSAPKEFPDA